jgi:hypothetical protein
MNSRLALRLGMPALACAAAFCANEVWNTKDPSVWTTEDANTVLNNSPWAKQIKVTPPQSGARRGGGMGRRGGMGYPGGGYPSGGGGYPGGGGGYPGGGRGGSGGGSSTPINGTIRWESAKPVQQAEARLTSLRSSYDGRPADAQADAKPEAKAEGKPSDHYVISLLGVRPPGSRNSSSDDSDDNGNNSKRGNNQAFDQFMSSTQLVMKNKTPISPDNVKFINESGQSEIRFFFPKTSPITLEDKEVTFQTMVGRTKVEHKFEFKKMVRNGKLELD